MVKKITILASLLIIAAVLCGAQSDLGIDVAHKKGKSESKVTLNVVAPPIPDSIDFAGERTPLGDNTIKEWLTNEIIVTQNMHSSTLKGMLYSKRYFDIIEPILEKNGIPKDFKYLCVAESGLYCEASSPVGASGMWQIMAATAREHGLEVGSDIDERYNLEKSTEVACDYLNQSYKRFGNWTLAAASYNMGQAGLAQRIETQCEKDFYALALPIETMRYIFRILSFKILYTNPSAIGYNIAEEDYYPLFDCDTVSVCGKNINWADVARNHGTTYRKLRELNPWLRDYLHANSAGKVYTIKIPKIDGK